MNGNNLLEPDQTIGEYIEQRLITDGIIEEGSIVFINNNGGIEDTVIGKTSEWEFNSTEAGLITITKYLGNDVKVVVPNVINNKKVKAIEGSIVEQDDDEIVYPVFSSSEGVEIEEVKISHGITGINELAFFECSSLKKVSIPDSVISIGNAAFIECTSLENITLPKSLKSIGDVAFLEAGLKNIIIPEGTISIGSEAFASCMSLESVVIPISVQIIKEEAFYACNENLIIKMRGPERTFNKDWNLRTFSPTTYNNVIWNYTG